VALVGSAAAAVLLTIVPGFEGTRLVGDRDPVAIPTGPVGDGGRDRLPGLVRRRAEERALCDTGPGGLRSGAEQAQKGDAIQGASVAHNPCWPRPRGEAL